MNDMRKFMKLMEDCDTGVDKNDDGECSPFTHADDNVEMVREDPGHSIFDIMYEGDVYHFVDDLEYGNWDSSSSYANALEDYYYDEIPYEIKTGDHGDSSEWIKERVMQDYGDEIDAIAQKMGREHSKVAMGEDSFEEDFLIPPKDAKYDVDLEVEEEDDDWDERDAPELDRQTDFDAPPRDDGDDSYDGDEGWVDDDDDLGRYDGDEGWTGRRGDFAKTGFDEDGPGDDEDDFDADPDAMVDVGDDEDYEVFDFDDEFERMMGNTHRFDEEDVMEMNALRKAAGLNEKKIISKDDVEAAGGEVRGKSSEITGGPGTTTSHRGGDEVVITKMRTLPNLKQWWKEDPEELMSMAYWGKDQLPPSDSEAWQRNWEKLKASLAKKYGEAPVEEAEGDKCPRCRKGTMERGETFFGPQARCNHCNYQRDLKESTDSRDDYVPFKFDDEKAYFLVADECGEMMEFGMEDDVVLLPDQWVDQVLVLLKDHGFEKGKDFSVAGMEEDFQNGYDDRHSVDNTYGDRFPKGATSSPARDVGPAGGKHGDNPMRTPMASIDKEDEVYESYRKAYRRFRRSK